MISTYELSWLETQRDERSIPGMPKCGHSDSIDSVEHIQEISGYSEFLKHYKKEFESRKGQLESRVVELVQVGSIVEINEIE